MDEVKLSEAMTLLTHIWKCALRVKPFSDRRLSATMDDALELAIKGGLKFALEDCADISKTFKVGAGYFTEQFLSFGDGFYTKAVISKNMSACHTFEHCKGRKPFMMTRVDHPTYYVSGIFDWTRPRDRLALGSKFIWQGERVTVTSFDDKNGKVIACSYKPQKRDEKGYISEPLKIAHIYKLTHKDLKGREQIERRK